MLTFSKLNNSHTQGSTLLLRVLSESLNLLSLLNNLIDNADDL